MHNAIKNLPEQFAWQAVIKNNKYLKKYSQFIILGMGGSHLAADLIKLAKPEIDIIVHSDYGLPKLTDKELKQCLIIANSYSGNTEEVLDGIKLALDKKLSVACISIGGQLIDLAIKNNLPYIQMPDTHIQPRMALGFNAKALAKLMGLTNTYQELTNLATQINPLHFNKPGKKLAKTLKNKIPVIYSSANNQAIAYNWKIKMNETGKVPAFYNVLPELNHNEMNGFDVRETTKNLSEDFCFIFLTDNTDHLRIQKRFKILTKLYKKNKLPVLTLPLKGKNTWQKIFISLTLADWTAYHLAKSYHLEPEPVPMVEKFKKLMK